MRFLLQQPHDPEGTKFLSFGPKLASQNTIKRHGHRVKTSHEECRRTFAGLVFEVFNRRTRAGGRPAFIYLDVLGTSKKF